MTGASTAGACCGVSSALFAALALTFAWQGNVHDATAAIALGTGSVIGFAWWS